MARNVIRRAPTCSIRKVRVGQDKQIIEFDNGERFTLDNAWLNAGAAIHFFQALLDARAAAEQRPHAADNPDPLSAVEQASPATARPLVAPATEGAFNADPPCVAPGDAAGAAPIAPPAGNRLTLPLHYVTFPTRCVGCGRQPVSAYSVSIMWAIFLLIVTLKTTAEIQVPVCRKCQVKRKVATSASLLLLILSFLTGILGIALRARGGAQDFPIVGIVACVVALILGVKFLDQGLDWLILGVRAVAMGKNVQTITLRFRDKKMAAAVAELTELRRRQHVQAAEQLLRSGR